MGRNCLECGEGIPPKRLLALPSTQFCLGCAERWGRTLKAQDLGEALAEGGEFSSDEALGNIGHSTSPGMIPVVTFYKR